MNLPPSSDNYDDGAFITIYNQPCLRRLYIPACRWWWWRWWWSIGVVQQLSQTRLWPPTTIMMGIVSADRVNHSRNKIMLNKNPPGLVIHHHSPGTVHEMNDNNEKNMLWLLLQPTYIQVYVWMSVQFAQQETRDHWPSKVVFDLFSQLTTADCGDRRDPLPSQKRDTHRW